MGQFFNDNVTGPNTPMNETLEEDEEGEEQQSSLQVKITES